MSRESCFINASLPMCAVCNKLVDKVSIHTNYATMDYYIVAHCHGDEDIATMDSDFLRENWRNVERGWAFTKKRIDKI